MKNTANRKEERAARREAIKGQILALNASKVDMVAKRKLIDKTDRKARKEAQAKIDEVRSAITELIKEYNKGRAATGSRIFANRDKTDFRTSALHFRD